MKNTAHRKWVVATIGLSLAAQALAYLAIPTDPRIGLPVTKDVAMTVRGGGSETVCSWFKSDECAEVVRSSDYSTCPAQTYYCRDTQGTEYVKNAGNDYCGTRREGDPQVYDCANVMIDTAGCAK